ncbi:Beta-hexosaminidase [Sphingomonas antarctica]|uniref:beta-N-acetylhexosaminidase n=1 Tax=Sphingomonas antarctica TaxID=2040274 RepID=UPI0039EAC1FD
MTPAIFGLAGPELTADERTFFADVKPAGYILFGRNIVDRAQVRALTDSLRALEGRDDVAILIDQEGGRVARMRPPEWPAFPAPGAFEALYDLAPISGIEAVRANARALGLMLSEVGINVDCLPLLDVRSAETHDAIGDRAFGTDPLLVAALGRAAIDGLREGGVVGVVKHMPGQGRAAVDSHHHLPTVSASAEDLARDLFPFQRLADAPMGMTGHIVFEAWDAERPATLSPTVIGDVIRGQIGFDGFLMSDDLDMKALSGSVATRAADCVAAGCDVALNCWGRMDEMVAIAAALPAMTTRGRERLDAAMATAGAPEGDFAEAIAKRDALLAQVA